MRFVTTATGVVLACVLALTLAGPAWGQGIVQGGLIGAHDAGLYGGFGDWQDEVLGDDYDASGTPSANITHVGPAGNEPGYFTGFSGADEITFDVGPTVIGTGDFTFSMWVNKSSEPVGSHSGFIGDTSTGSGFSIFQISSVDGQSGSALRNQFTDGNSYANWDSGNAHNPGAGPNGPFPNAPPLFDGNWHMYTFTGSGQQGNIYFDDEDVTVPQTVNAVDMSNNAPLHINSVSHGDGRILSENDRVNKVLFYDRALMPGEIAANFAAGPRATVTGGGPSVDGEWINDGTGSWNDDKNWDIFPAPNTRRHTAMFGDMISAPTTAVVDTDVTINTITFDHTISYGVGGLASINLESNTTEPPRSPAISVVQGHHQFQVVTNLVEDTTADVASESSLTFNNALNLMGNTLTKTGAGTMTINNQLTLGGGTVDVQEGTVAGIGAIGGDLNNVGGTLSPGSSAGEAVSAVPEPSAVAWLVLGLSVLLGCRHRRFG